MLSDRHQGGALALRSGRLGVKRFDARYALASTSTCLRTCVEKIHVWACADTYFYIWWRSVEVGEG